MSNNKTDDILNVVCAWDWITPLYVILRDAYTGSVTHFGVYAYGGFDRGAIRRLLSKNGIESWGYIYNVDGDLIMFSVREEQAAAADEVLKRGGVPVLGGPAGEPTETVKPGATLGNSFHTGKMELVEAPSIWKWLARKLARRGTK